MKTLRTGDPCPVCHAALTLIVRRVDQYAYWRCPACSHVTALPIPSAAEIAAYYHGFLFGRVDTRQVAHVARKVEQDVGHILEDIRALTPMPGPLRLLDWGGGTGFYASAFASRGFDVTLLDLDPESTRYATETFPGRFRVVTGDPADNPGTAEFEIAYCSHVIEHYADLGRFVGSLRRLLTPGGVAIVATPNQQCKEFYFRWAWLLAYLRMAKPSLPAALFRFLRVPWICCDPPRHFHAFNAQSLRTLFEASGFEVASCFSEPITRQYYSAGRFKGDWEIRRPLSLLRVLGEFCALAGLTSLRFLDRRRRWGNNLVLIARKPVAAS